MPGQRALILAVDGLRAGDLAQLREVFGQTPAEALIPLLHPVVEHLDGRALGQEPLPQLAGGEPQEVLLDPGADDGWAGQPGLADRPGGTAAAGEGLELVGGETPP